VQRADRTRRFVGRIKLVRIRERVRIDRDDRVDHRAFLVIGRDAVEIELRQLMRGQRAGLVRRLDGIDRRLHHWNGAPAGRCATLNGVEAARLATASALAKIAAFQRLHLAPPKPTDGRKRLWAFRG
jgi:hypothetical protein